MRSLKRCWFVFKGKNVAGEVQIDLLGEIGGWGISAKEFKEELARVGSNQPINLRINSDGGDLIAGNEIYNILMAHDGPVHVSIGALAASIASVIAMVGDTISIAENGWIMVHNPWSAAMGDSEEFRKIAGVLDGMKKSIVRAYVRQTGKSEQEIAQLMDQETWLDAEMALEAGFVDSIDTLEPVTAVNDLRAASRFALNGFQHAAQFQNSLRKNLMSKQVTVVQDGGPPEGDEPKVIVSNERNRFRDIMAIVDMIRERDKLDFSAEAQKAIDAGTSAGDFSRSCVLSPKFKDTFQVVGGGVQDFPNDPGAAVGLGAAIVHSEAYQGMIARGGLQRGQSIHVQVPRSIFAFRPRNATPVTTTGIQTTQFIGPEGFLALPQPHVADLLSSYPTGESNVNFTAETSFTNAAGVVAEGTAKPEQTWNFAPKVAPVKKVAVWSKVTEELTMDNARLSAFINLKLQLAVMLALDIQLISGDGTGINFTGILNTAGIQTQPKGTDTDLDALRKALTKIRSISFFEPDAYLLNPTDWEKQELAKDSQNRYLGGGPFILPGVPTLWGKPVVQTTSIAAGTALAGAFKISGELYPRTGLLVSMTNSDQDDFIKNLLTIRVEQRCALGIVHPLGFCSITGLV